MDSTFLCLIAGENDSVFHAQEREGSVPLGVKNGWSHAVSYTHLDVYKRQDIGPGLRQFKPGLRHPVQGAPAMAHKTGLVQNLGADSHGRSP